MTLKYEEIRRFRHEWYDCFYFTFKGAELYGEPLIPHRRPSSHNRVVLLSENYVIKVDNPFYTSTTDRAYLNQGAKEYKAYKKLSKKQRSFVPELVEAGQIYLPVLYGAWAWYTVTERIYGVHPRYDDDVNQNLKNLFRNVTRDFHSDNIITDKENKQWLIDLGF